MTQTQLPTLYGLSSNGKLKQWTIEARYDSGQSYAELVTIHGYVNGKKQRTSKKVQGKNIGKSNFKTHYEQAIFDAQSQWKKKYDANYRESEKELKSVPALAMLALEFNVRKHDIDWSNAYVQPKLNGVRCIAEKVSDTVVTYTSRKNKQWQTLGYMTEELLPLLASGHPIDGELFNPDLTFQEITKRAKRVKTSRADIQKDPLQFHMFDVVAPDLSFEERYGNFTERYAKQVIYGPSISDSSLALVPTFKVRSEKDVMKYHDQFVLEGYEGIMIRNGNGLYLPGYRSKDLQKYKDFIDKEFLIIGGHEGEGRDENTIIFRCITEDGNPFDVRPKGTWEKRNLWWNTLESLIGKTLTVRFQNYSDDGVPIFPRGLEIRDYE